MKKVTCPRRIETFGVWEFKENEDYYRRRDNTCSFCGSWEPDAFMQAVRDGALLEPTDKNYKVYLEIEGRSFTKFYFQHLSSDQQQEFVDLYNRSKIRIWGIDSSGQVHDKGRFYVLPFFMRRAD